MILKETKQNLINTQNTRISKEIEIEKNTTI